MKGLSIVVFSVLLTGVWCVPARADLQEGQKAQFFRTVDEKLQPVDMEKLFVGRPLVLIVGSCS